MAHGWDAVALETYSIPLFEGQTLVFLFVWLGQFAGHHKSVAEGGCFLSFSAPIWVWHMRFSSHAQRGSVEAGTVWMWRCIET
jgi:hypothetical protein